LYLCSLIVMANRQSSSSSSSFLGVSLGQTVRRNGLPFLSISWLPFGMGKLAAKNPTNTRGLAALVRCTYVLSRTRSQCHMQRTPTAVQTLRKTEGHKWGSEMCRIVSFCGRTHCAMGQRALEWKEKRARGGAAQLIWDLPSVCHYYLLHHLRHSSLTSHHTVTLSFTLYSRSLYRRG
jgi:hypothetical protein